MGDWATEYPVPVTDSPPPPFYSVSVAQRGRRHAWGATDEWFGPLDSSPPRRAHACPAPHGRAPSPRAAPLLARSIPAGIRRPTCYFYNINQSWLDRIGSASLTPPLFLFYPASPSQRGPSRHHHHHHHETAARCPPATEPVSPPLTLSLSSKQVVLSRRSSARLQLRPDPAPFPPFAGAVPPCVLCLLAALVSAGQGGGCRCSGWSVPSFPSSRGCEGRSARGSLRASFFLLADC